LIDTDKFTVEEQEKMSLPFLTFFNSSTCKNMIKRSVKQNNRLAWISYIVIILFLWTSIWCPFMNRVDIINIKVSQAKITTVQEILLMIYVFSYIGFPIVLLVIGWFFICDDVVDYRARLFYIGLTKFIQDQNVLSK